MKKNKIIISILSITIAVSIMVPGLSAFAVQTPDTSGTKIAQPEKTDAPDKEKQDENKQQIEKKKVDLLTNNIKNDVPAYVVKQVKDKNAKAVVMVPGKAIAKALGLKYVENDRQIRITAANVRCTIKNDKDYVLYEKFKGKKSKKKKQLKAAEKALPIDGQTYLSAEIFKQLLTRDTFTVKIGKKTREILYGRVYTFLKEDQYIFNHI